MLWDLLIVGVGAGVWLALAPTAAGRVLRAVRIPGLRRSSSPGVALVLSVTLVAITLRWTGVVLDVGLRETLAVAAGQPSAESTEECGSAQRFAAWWVRNVTVLAPPGKRASTGRQEFAAGRYECPTSGRRLRLSADGEVSCPVHGADPKRPRAWP